MSTMGKEGSTRAVTSTAHEAHERATVDHIMVVTTEGAVGQVMNVDSCEEDPMRERFDFHGLDEQLTQTSASY